MLSVSTVLSKINVTGFSQCLLIVDVSSECIIRNNFNSFLSIQLHDDQGNDVGRDIEWLVCIAHNSTVV